MWGVNEIDNRELELLKKFKVTNISIWKKKDKDFYKKCKDFGFRVTSLFHISIMKPKIMKYSPIQTNFHLVWKEYSKKKYVKISTNIKI